MTHHWLPGVNASSWISSAFHRGVSSGKNKYHSILGCSFKEEKEQRRNRRDVHMQHANAVLVGAHLALRSELPSSKNGEERQTVQFSALRHSFNIQLFMCLPSSDSLLYLVKRNARESKRKTRCGWRSSRRSPQPKA